MHFDCRPVDAAFFKTAPVRFDNVVELVAKPADVFAVLEDLESWPKWFGGMNKVVWASKEHGGVGAERTVSMTMVALDEHFFRWEKDRRLSFYLTGHSRPLVHALAEDYLLEEINPGRTRFTYVVAMEPRPLVRMGGPLSRAYFGSMFRNACKGLFRYVASAH